MLDSVLNMTFLEVVIFIAPFADEKAEAFQRGLNITPVQGHSPWVKWRNWLFCLIPESLSFLIWDVQSYHPWSKQQLNCEVLLSEDRTSESMFSVQSAVENKAQRARSWLRYLLLPRAERTESGWYGKGSHSQRSVLGYELEMIPQVSLWPSEVFLPLLFNNQYLPAALCCSFRFHRCLTARKRDALG